MNVHIEMEGDTGVTLILIVTPKDMDEALQLGRWMGAERTTVDVRVGAGGTLLITFAESPPYFPREQGDPV